MGIGRERESDLEDAMPVLIKGFAQRAGGGIVGSQNSSPESCVGHLRG